MYGPGLNRLAHHLRRCCLAVCVGLSLTCPLLVQAQTQYYDAFRTASGQMVISSSNGVSTIPAASRGQLIWDSAVGLDGGMPKVSGAGSLTNPAGRAVAIAGTGRIPAAQVAKAVGRFAGKAIAPVAIAIALGELARDLGFKFGPADSEGKLPVTKTGGHAGLKCVFNSGAYNGVLDAFSYVPYQGIDAAEYGCRQSIPGDNDAYGVIKPAPENLGTQEPSTRQAFLDAVAAKSGWPSGSPIEPILKDAIANPGNDPLQVPTITITGPSTSPGASKVTKNTTNNTTKTETTQYNHTYDDNSVRTTSTTNTAIVNNTNNTEISNETTNNDTPPEPAKNDCESNPDRIGCANLDTPEGEIPRETKEVTFTPDPISWGAGAACPAAQHFVAPVTGQDVALEYTPFCDVATRARPFILAGAGFVAMMIVMAGIRP